MLNKNSFKAKALKEAKKYFKTVHMSQAQHKIFLDFVNIFLKYIPIEEISAKGIGWKAVKEWQLKHSRDLIGLEEEDEQERIHSISQILKDHVKPDLLEKLLDREDEELLDKAIEDILEHYKKTYAGR